MIFKLRRAGKPQKQLFFLWLSLDMKQSHRYETGLELACGHLPNYPFFRTKRYIGVDINESRMEEGKRKYPDAETIACSIEEMPADVKGDFVLCSETIGFNRRFSVNNTPTVLERMTDATSEGGMLIFNIAGDAFKRYECMIDQKLEESFDSVEKRLYGNREKRAGGEWGKTIRHALSLLLAIWMHLFPSKRVGGGPPRAYYVCTGKRDTNSKCAGHNSERMSFRHHASSRRNKEFQYKLLD